jgi:hypothetical protein
MQRVAAAPGAPWPARGPLRQGREPDRGLLASQALPRGARCGWARTPPFGVAGLKLRDFRSVFRICGSNVFKQCTIRCDLRLRFVRATSNGPKDTAIYEEESKKAKRKPKLILARDSVRKLAAPDRSGIVGGAHMANCVTVTFSKCCLTL